MYEQIVIFNYTKIVKQFKTQSLTKSSDRYFAKVEALNPWQMKQHVPLTRHRVVTLVNGKGDLDNVCNGV